jgi:plasmid stability protein
MKLNCSEVQSDLTLYFYGELEGDHEELLEQHLADCPSCRAELAQLQSLLSQVDEAHSAGHNGVPAEPPAELLSRCRTGLRAAIAPSFEREPAWRRMLSAFQPPAWAWRPAMALALVGAGFFGGKAFEQSRSVTSNIAEIARVRNIQGLGDGTVRIVYEEPRERTISGSLAQSDIQALLLAATRQSADPSLRLESVDLLRNRINRDDIRQVFLQTLVKDQDPGVRLRALQALRPYSEEAEVRRALSSVLLQDGNPNVRVLAIDVLVDRQSHDMVGTLQQVIRQEDNEYVRSRCAKALSAMRASPGTF